MYSSYAQSFFPFSGQKMMNKNPLQKDEKELGKSWKLTRNQMMPRFKGEEPFPAFWVSRVAHLSKGDANKTKESRQVCEMILGKLPKYIFLNKDEIFLNKDQIFLNRDQILLNKDEIYLNKD